MADEEKQEREELHEAVRETEKELLEGAFAPEEKAEEPKEQTEAKGERVRDPQTGRFVSATPITEQSEQSQGGEQKPDEEILPSWRAREINEERRRVQDENERLRVEHARLSAYVQQQRAAQPPPKPEMPQLPDPVLDYPGFVKANAEWTRAQIDAALAQQRQQQETDRLNFNLELARVRYGDSFEKAFEALVTEGQRGNNQLIRHLIGQSNPGDAVMRWFNDESMRKEVGSDLSAYKQKLRDSLLNDPEFLSQAAERAREVATGGRPNTVVKMPPSLSKATGTAEVPQTATDGSEEAIFAWAMNQKRR